MKQQRAYQYRFYPTDEQAHILAQTFGCARYVYNFALRLRTDAYSQEQKRVGYHETSAALTVLKKQEGQAWLNDVASVPLQQSLRHLDRAFRNFFEGRAKYPTFKKKQGEQAISYVGTAFKLKGTDLTLAKMDEPLAIHWSRPLPKGCKPITVTVCKDTANRYFVSLLVEEDITPLEVSNKQVGLDLGLKSMVVTSDGHTFGNPKFLAEEKKKLAKAQRRHAKKKKSSKNHSLAQAISDVGWGEFVRQLEYKAEWYGRTLIKIDKWYPSSKRCFDCGHMLDSLPLDIRVWTCPECGVVHDRDINAARNIHAVGLTVFEACGEAVRPGRAKARSGKLR